MKGKILSIVICLLLALGFSNTAFAAETGQIELVLDSADIDAAALVTGEGFYVFIENIDTGDIYRFPVNKSNDYSERYELAYGNYRTISDPEGVDGDPSFTSNDVFALSDQTPKVKVVVSFGTVNGGGQPEPLQEEILRISGEEGQESINSGKTDGDETEQIAESSELGSGATTEREGGQESIDSGEEEDLEDEEEDSSRSFSFQNIFVLVVLGIIVVMWVYYHFIKNSDNEPES